MSLRHFLAEYNLSTSAGSQGLLRPDFDRSRYGHLSHDNPLLGDGKAYINGVAFSEAIAEEKAAVLVWVGGRHAGVIGRGEGVG